MSEVRSLWTILYFVVTATNVQGADSAGGSSHSTGNVSENSESSPQACFPNQDSVSIQNSSKKIIDEMSQLQELYGKDFVLNPAAKASLDKVLSEIPEADQKVILYNLNVHIVGEEIKNNVQAEETFNELLESNPDFKAAHKDLNKRIFDVRRMMKISKARRTSDSDKKFRYENKGVSLNDFDNRLAESRLAITRIIREEQKRNPEKVEELKRLDKWLFEASSAVSKDVIEYQEKRADKMIRDAEIGLGIATLVRDSAVTAGATVVALGTVGGGGTTATGAAVAAGRTVTSGAKLVSLFSRSQKAYKALSTKEKLAAGKKVFTVGTTVGSAFGAGLSTGHKVIDAIGEGNFFCNYYKESLVEGQGTIQGALLGGLMGGGLAFTSVAGGPYAAMTILAGGAGVVTYTSAQRVAAATEAFQKGDYGEVYRQAGHMGLDVASFVAPLKAAGITSPKKLAESVLKGIEASAHDVKANSIAKATAKANKKVEVSEVSSEARSTSKTAKLSEQDYGDESYRYAAQEAQRRIDAIEATAKANGDEKTVSKVRDLRNHVEAEVSRLRADGASEREIAIAWTHDIGKVAPVSTRVQQRGAAQALRNVVRKNNAGEDLTPPESKLLSTIQEDLSAAGITGNAQKTALNAIAEDKGLPSGVFGRNKEVANVVLDGDGNVKGPYRAFFAEAVDHGTNSRDYWALNPLLAKPGAGGKPAADNLTRQLVLDGIGHDDFSVVGSWGNGVYKPVTGVNYPNRQTQPGSNFADVDRLVQVDGPIVKGEWQNGPHKIANELSNFMKPEVAIRTAMNEVTTFSKAQFQRLQESPKFRSNARSEKIYRDGLEKIAETEQLNGATTVYSEGNVARPSSAPQDAIGHVELPDGNLAYFSDVASFWGAPGKPGAAVLWKTSGAESASALPTTVIANPTPLLQWSDEE